MAEKKAEEKSLSRQEKLDLEAEEAKMQSRQALSKASKGTASFNEASRQLKEMEEKKHGSKMQTATIAMAVFIGVVALLLFVFREQLSSIQIFSDSLYSK